MKRCMIKVQLLIVIFILSTVSGFGQKYTGLTATASSGTASAAVDNNMGTRWESVQGIDPQSITVDLGAEKNVGAIKLYWEGANAKNYSISFSTDGSTFSGDLYFTDKAAGTRTDLIDNLGVTCRYIKMNGTARNLTYGYSIWEFEVYPPVVPVLTSLVVTPANASITLGASQQFTVSGLDQLGNSIALTNSTTWSVNGTGASIDANGLFSATTKGLYTVTATNTSITKTTTIDVIPAYSNLSIGASATASSGTASAAIDNNGGTRWESAQSDPQWIMVDLGAVKKVTDIFIVWEAANSKDYIIQTSSDNLTWTTIISKSGMPNMARTDRIYDLNVLGRYIRLTGTARNLTYGHSIWEFKIYGTTPNLYRSTATGNWNDVASWETSTDNVNWTPAVLIPSANADQINIQRNQAMTMDVNVTTTSLTLQPSAKLTLNAGNTLIANTITLNSDA
ncbi:MAG TPA: discoidin domain-containing protein, partial [Paludibacter sp.]